MTNGHLVKKASHVFTSREVSMDTIIIHRADVSMGLFPWLNRVLCLLYHIPFLYHNYPHLVFNSFSSAQVPLGGPFEQLLYKRWARFHLHIAVACVRLWTAVLYDASQCYSSVQAKEHRQIGGWSPIRGDPVQQTLDSVPPQSN